MSGSIAGSWWLTRPETVAVMDALEAEGGPGCARFVGGCVRNAVMGRTEEPSEEAPWPTDIDIATTLTPDRTVSALERAGLKAVPTGLKHGTVTGVSGKRPFEITTLRRDVETDGRHAEVAFTESWAEDAARRDFRLNALYADRSGAVFDPTGEGLADARAGRVVFVGDPAARIAEDYLRILRFFRFFAWYGRGEPDAEGLAACARLKAGMAQLSAERVQAELMKLLAAPTPRPALNRMEKAGVLAQVLPEATDTSLFHKLATLSDDPVQLLASLLPPEAAVAREAAGRLRLPNAVRDRLIGAALDGPPVTPPVGLDMTEREARAAIYRIGWQAFRDRLTLDWAREPWREEDFDRLFALEDWTPPRLPVGGREVEALGVAAGPRTGEILKAFEAGWIADDFPDDGHDARLKALVEGAA